MKSLLLAACLLCACSLFAQTNDEKAIRAVMDVQTNAWNNGNIPAFMETYWKSDSLVFIGKNGPNYGWQNTLDGYKKRYPDTVAMGKLRFDILQVRQLSAEYYFVIGNFYLQRSIGNLSGTFTLLFRKMSGHWIIVADHTS